MSGRFFLIASAVGLLVIDRWLKYMAVQGTDAHWFLFHFQKYENFGIIFSIPVSSIFINSAMAVALLLVSSLAIRAWRADDDRRIFATLLLMTGAVSNIYDRFMHGYVIDWASFGRWWPVFNLADVLIAAGLIIYLSARRRPLIAKPVS